MRSGKDAACRGTKRWVCWLSAVSISEADRITVRRQRETTIVWDRATGEPLL